MSEYVLLLALLVTAFLGIQIYVRRGLQGRVRNAADFLVTAANQALGRNFLGQYEPEYRSHTRDIIQRSSMVEKMFLGGKRSKKYDESTETTQNETTH